MGCTGRARRRCALRPSGSRRTTLPTSRSRPAVRRSGASRRPDGCAACSTPVRALCGSKCTADLPDGVELTEVAADDPLRRKAPAPADRTAALAFRHAEGAVALRVARERRAVAPGGHRAQGQRHAPRRRGATSSIEVGANASATVVIDHTGSATFAGLLLGDRRRRRSGPAGQPPGLGRRHRARRAPRRARRS